MDHQSAAGTFNYTVTTTGGSCTQATATGSVTVNSTPSQSTITQGNDTLYSSTIVAGATYNWYLNGSATPTASTSTPYFKFTVQGTYRVELVSNGCNSVLSASLLTTSLGVKTSNNLKSSHYIQILQMADWY
ncbi:MAG: hypothetical protein IPF58_02155 [Saprospirales bacterium]|nr:hypothetical protein [Saprospirales bacterium]